MNQAEEFVVPDITVRKNAGLSHDTDYTMPQPLDRYTAADHATWATLYARQVALLPGRACDEYLDGIAALEVSPQRIPDFAELNRHLMAATGWQLVAVPGLIPGDVFFEHLAHRRFPVTWWIREPDSLDYLPEPDIFHDLFGHVPLLMNPVFADYVQAYGKGGVKADSLGGLDMLARLYWFTVEFGLINTPKGLRIYGAGILSSSSESHYSLESDSPNRLGFDLMRIMKTRYRYDSFQKTYFVIDSFEQLFKATEPDFAPLYAAIADRPDIPAGDILPGDKVLHQGTQEGWPDTEDA
ncbi:phenylalanine-4-hydroxylase [Silvimonas terrae]|uniref:Phenylalanine-4-hydroxylase n=1 Tax=Silvimonas terrae TaxID=300266 RepID=A0A840RF69_9NEIS|nr:phenylalanine 4-monooxygenase [Silvimonas terrae]MBB5192179.1 phenylalanine-4-hydroxylase [Silvimonas terrae]